VSSAPVLRGSFIRVLPSLSSPLPKAHLLTDCFGVRISTKEFEEDTK
jgi:hypothetical protein